MSFFKNNYILIPLFLYTFLCGGCIPNHRTEMGYIPTPSIYNMDHLNELKKKGIEDPAISRFIRRVKKIANEEPLSVYGKEHSYSSNPHDYCSIAGYSWPDENNPKGPYITKDGILNPAVEKYDRPKLDELSNRCKFLSVAFYITEDSTYSNALLRNIRTWFLDSLTFMTPHLEYASVVKGKNNDKGQAYGLVDIRQFTPIIESVLLVNSVTKVDVELLELKSWFSSFLEWMLDSWQWKQISWSNNNIASACYVAIVEMAYFTGDMKLAKKMERVYTRRILNTQIMLDGRQPAELKRTIGFGYSVGNLRNIVDFALIMENTGTKYYMKNQRRIDAAFEYLLQFVDHHEAFPYQQIKPWEHYEELLKENAMRLQRMSSRKSKVNTYARSLTMDYSKDILDYVY